VLLVATIDITLGNRFPEVAIAALDLEGEQSARRLAIDDDLELGIYANIAHALFAE
jgi:hypothetical protein